MVTYMHSNGGTVGVKSMVGCGVGSMHIASSHTSTCIMCRWKGMCTCASIRILTSCDAIDN